MNKIYYIIFIALLGFSFASCSDDDNNGPAESSVKVTSAETAIDASGGSKVITVNRSDISVKAEDSWLKVAVNGNTLTVSAEANQSRESRHTLVVVKATNGDSTLVNVSQYGLVFVFGESSIFSPTDEVTTIACSMKHNESVTILSSPEWAQSKLESDSIRITLSKNTTGHIRKGYIKYQTGAVVDSVSVMQYDFNKDIAGSYYLAYTNSKGKLSAFNATLSDGHLTLPDLGFDFAVDFDKTTCSLSVKSGQKLGKYRDYFIYLIFMNAAGDKWTQYYTGYHSDATFDYDEENGTSSVFGGSFEGNNISYFVLEAFSADSMSSTNDLGALTDMLNPYLLKK